MGIPENIKRLRTARGLSQMDLAKILNVSDRTVSTWEMGTRIPRMGNIQAMADLFNVQKTDIIEDKKLPATEGEERLDRELIEKLTMLTSDEKEKVVAFVQGLLAAR